MSCENKKSKFEIHVESFACAECGIIFGINDEVTKIWKKSHQRFLCPNGHSLSWKETIENDNKDESKDLLLKIKSLETQLEQTKKEIKLLKEELEIWKP
jgi:hypothetical protein